MGECYIYSFLTKVFPSIYQTRDLLCCIPLPDLQSQEIRFWAANRLCIITVFIVESITTAVQSIDLRLAFFFVE